MLNRVDNVTSFKSARYYGMPVKDETRKLISQVVKSSKKDITCLERRGINFDFVKRAEDNAPVEFYIFKETDSEVTSVSMSFIINSNIEEIQKSVKRGIERAKEFLKVNP